MNCPVHMPSQLPPFPIILANPFFSILANPSVAEILELKSASRKNPDLGLITDDRDDPGTNNMFYTQ